MYITRPRFALSNAYEFLTRQGSAWRRSKISRVRESKWQTRILQLSIFELCRTASCRHDNASKDAQKNHVLLQWETCPVFIPNFNCLRQAEGNDRVGLPSFLQLPDKDSTSANEAMAINRNGLYWPVPRSRRMQLSLGYNLSTHRNGTLDPCTHNK
jgi:hypothetical protein